MNLYDAQELSLIEMSRQQRETIHTTPFVRELQKLIEQGMSEDAAEAELMKQAEEALSQKED